MPNPDITPRQAELIARYGHLLNNTGGNDPADLLHDLKTSKNLAATNIVVFTLAASVQSQLTLLGTLESQGLLTPPAADEKAEG